MLASLTDFIKVYFDKLLLSVLFLLGMTFLLHAVHHAVDSGTVSWIENTVGQILAALLTLMVGRSLTQRAGDNGSQPNGGAK